MKLLSFVILDCFSMGCTNSTPTIRSIHYICGCAMQVQCWVCVSTLLSLDCLESKGIFVCLFWWGFFLSYQKDFFFTSMCKRVITINFALSHFLTQSVWELVLSHQVDFDSLSNVFIKIVYRQHVNWSTKIIITSQKPSKMMA